MNKTVIIDCDQQGQYSVGVEPPDAGGSAGDAGGAGDAGAAGNDEAQIDMQPAKSMDDALQMAKALFSQPGGQDDQGASQGDQGADQAFQAGYQGVNGGASDTAPTPGGM